MIGRLAIYRKGFGALRVADRRSRDRSPRLRPQSGSFCPFTGTEMQRSIAIMKTRLVQVGTLAALSVAAVAPTRVLLAQGSPSVQAQLAFGYECDDKFVVRNDGT